MICAMPKSSFGVTSTSSESKVCGTVFQVDVACVIQRARGIIDRLEDTAYWKLFMNASRRNKILCLQKKCFYVFWRWGHCD